MIVDVLPESSFGKENKAVYRLQGDLTPKTMELFSIKDTIPKASKYQYLNPLQTVFYKFYEKGSALVCAPTSAGKSLISYIFMRNRKGRKVYVAPLRALVQEKTAEFRELFDNKVDMRTGENILEKFKPLRGEVLVTTYENLILAFRNNADWLADVSCIVFDEIHQMVKKWSVEEAVVYALDKKIDILGLSATLPDYQAIAKWMNASLVIYSSWRPVPLQREINHLNNLVGDNLRIHYVTPETKKFYKFFHLLWSFPSDDQILFFVPSKNAGWKFLELANQEKISIMNKTVPFIKDESMENVPPEIAFHNADIPTEEKHDIVKAFREGRLKKLVATQTLAYGLNLPADRVVIYVTQRNDPVEGTKIIPDSLDILQMEGRAGRLGIKDKGYSHIVVYGASLENVQDAIKTALTGSLKERRRYISEDTLSMLILTGVHYRKDKYKEFLNKLYFRDLIEKEDIDRVYRKLKRDSYIVDDALSGIGAYCLQTGIPPFKFEEFLIRNKYSMDVFATIRPLLHMKIFGDTERFCNEKALSSDGHEAVLSIHRQAQASIMMRYEECLKDNTDDFLAYINGVFFYYSNISSPPGEFSSLGVDTLHLVRVLTDLKAKQLYNITYADIIRIAHSIKTGLSYDYALLGGIPGIGYMRGNLLKNYLETKGHLKAIEMFSRVSDVFSINQSLQEDLADILIAQRNMKEPKALQEASKVVAILQRNQDFVLMDDKILLSFALFAVDKTAYKYSKQDLLKLVNNFLKEVH